MNSQKIKECLKRQGYAIFNFRDGRECCISIENGREGIEYLVDIEDREYEYTNSFKKAYDVIKEYRTR